MCWMLQQDQFYFALEIVARSVVFLSGDCCIVLLIVAAVSRSVVLFSGDCSRVSFINCGYC